MSIGNSEKRENAKQTAVRSRLVLNFPGFENIGSEACLDRLFHCAEKTGEVYRFSVTPKDGEAESASCHAVREFVSQADHWRLQSRVVQFDWYDIVESYENRAYPAGFVRNLGKYLVIFLDGTLRRYLRASRLYFVFSIYAILLLALFGLIAAVASVQLVRAIGLGEPLEIPVMIIGGLLLWLLLCRWPGDFLFLNTTISNWGFAWDLTNRKNDAITKRMESFSDVMLAEIEASKHDEIVVCGHSLGCVWAICALAMAVERNPDLLRNKRIGFLSLGSSHLKIALCREAGWLRSRLRSVLEESTVFWHEFQSKDDVIAFYKADPFEPIDIVDFAARYKVDRVRFKLGMARQRYRAMKRSLYYTHNQYVRYYDKPVTFDFYLRIFGPFSVPDLAENPDLVFGLIEASEQTAAAG